MEILLSHLCRSIVASSFTQNSIVVIDATPTIYVYDIDGNFQSHSNVYGFTTYLHRYDHNIALSFDGSCALLCDTDKQRVLLVDVKSKKVRANLKCSKAPNFALFSCDSEYFMIANSVGFIAVYATKNMELLCEFAFADELSNAAFSNDLSKIAIASRNKKIYLYSLKTQTIVQTLECEEIIESLSFSKHDTSLLAFARDGNNIVYNLVHKQTYRAIPHSQWPSVSALTDTGEILILGSRGSELYLYTVARGNKIGTLELGYWGVTSLSVTNDRIFVGFSDGTGMILDVQEQIALAIESLQENALAKVVQLCYEHPLIFINSTFCALINEKYEQIFEFRANSREERLGYDALISYIIENDTKKQELLARLYHSKEIVSFMQKIERGDFDGACKNTYRYPLLRQMREFSEFRTTCYTNIAEEIRILEDNPEKLDVYRQEQSHNCTECIFGILANSQVLYKNFQEFQNSARASNYTTMFEIAGNFPAFKQSRIYRRVIVYAEALIDKILLMMQNDYIAEAEKYAIKLSQIKPFEKTGSDFKEQIRNFAGFKQAIRNGDILKIFTLVDQNPAYRTTKEFKEELHHYQNKHNIARKQALLGDVNMMLASMGEYLKIDYFQEQNFELKKLALVYEIKHYAPENEEKELLQRYHEYYGWDEGYQIVCDLLRHKANTIQKITPVLHEHKEVQTLLNGERVNNKNIEKKEENNEIR